MRKRGSARRLMAESLERRALMAGDILASVNNGILFLRGDAADNAVVISNNASGQLEITGAEAGGTATTINGEASYTTTGTLRGVVIDTGSGNDLVQFGTDAAVKMPWWVGVATGAGDDHIEGSLNSAGLVAFGTGTGNDQVALQDSTIGTLTVNTDPLLGKNLQPGADEVSLTNVTVPRFAAIRTGAGDDTVDVTGGAFARGLGITTDQGADSVEVQGVADGAALAIGNTLAVNAGAGNDTVNIQRVSVSGIATVTAGDGDDTIDAEELNAVDGIFAYLGTGNDSLSLSSSKSNRVAVLGGDGTDTLLTEGNTFGRLWKVGIEA